MQRPLQQHNSETWWRSTTATLLGISFRTYRRRCRDVVMGCCGYVPLRGRTTETSFGGSFETCLRRHGDVLMRHRCYVLLRRRYDVPIGRCGDVPVRRLGDVPPTRRWVLHLRSTCDVTGTYRETFLRRRHDVLLPGGYLPKFC